MSNKEFTEHKKIVKSYIYGLKKIATESKNLEVSNFGHGKRDYSNKEYSSLKKLTQEQFLFMKRPKWSDKKLTLLRQFVCDFWNYKKDDTLDIIKFNIEDLNKEFVQERIRLKKNTIYDKWPNVVVNCLPEIFKRIGKDNYEYDCIQALDFFNINAYNANNLFKLIVYRDRLYDYVCYVDWYENNKETNNDIKDIEDNMFNGSDEKNIDISSDDTDQMLEDLFEDEKKSTIDVLYIGKTEDKKGTSFRKIMNLIMDITINEASFKKVNDAIKILLETHTSAEINFSIKDIEDVLSIIKSKKI